MDKVDKPFLDHIENKIISHFSDIRKLDPRIDTIKNFLIARDATDDMILLEE